MGPFNGEALRRSSTEKEKVWVGTHRRGIDEARLTVVGPDRAPRHYARSRASAPGFSAFFPGLIDVTSRGRWTITADVGPDTMCVRVRFQ
jgi:hypothetical protein